MSKITLVSQGSSPSVPAAGRITLWAKASDKHVYLIDENGLEIDLTGATDANAIHVAGQEIATVAAGTPTLVDEFIFGDVGDANNHKKATLAALVALHTGASDVSTQKHTAGTITIGQAVYLAGYDTGASVITIELADANAAATMPVLGLAIESITDSASGSVRTSGELGGLDTSSFTVLDALYVSGTAGTLTATRPTGATDEIQIVGRVARVHATLGVIEIGNARRSNGLPNLTTGQVWLGDGTNQPVGTTRVGIDTGAFQKIGVGEISALAGVAAAGGDEVFINDLSDGGNPKKVTAASIAASGIPGVHALGGAQHSADTLSNFNTKLSDVVGGLAPAKSILLFNDYSVATSTTIRYLNPSGRDNGLAHTSELQVEVPYAGTVRNMRIVHSTVGVGGATLTYTARKGGASQTLTVGIASTATGGNDTSNSFTVAAGDKLSLQVTKSGSITSSPLHVYATMELQATGT